MNNWSRTLFDIIIFGFFVYLISTGYLNQFLEILGLKQSTTPQESTTQQVSQ
jgi:hypothetical protein